MPKSEADIRASLDAVIEDVENNQRIYGWFSHNVGEIARQTRNLATTMEHRFDQVDQRFAQVDQRFAQVEQRFDQVDRRFAQVDKRFEELEANLDRRFGLVDDRLNTIDARLEKLVGYIIREETRDSEADRT